MPRTFKCSFCGKGFSSATGLMYVRSDGSISYFCSRRCRVSLLSFGRDQRKFKWTSYYGRKERGK